MGGHNEGLGRMGLELVERLCGANRNFGDLVVHQLRGHLQRLLMSWLEGLL